MLIVAGLASISSAAGAADNAHEASKNSANRRPSFLVILVDDLGYGDLGCFGHPMIKTPHLDKLAGQGIRLTECYSAAPVCSPSRAGLLTGRAPSRVGIYDWIPANHPMHMAREEVTVATLLRKAGYATCHVGKWHLNGKFNSPEQPQPGDHGFDHWLSTQNNAAPTHHNPVNFVRNGEAAGKIEGYACQVVADEAIGWLREKRDPEKPFFLFVCFHEPHEPIDSPPDLVAEYPAATHRGEALYYANVANMDRAVGRLAAALDDMKLAEETLVFFTSDNGPETLNRYAGAWRSHGSPGEMRGMKLHLYEGGIRVPGILRWTGRVKPGQELNEPVCGVDVLSTLCELAGIAPPADRKIDGTSFVPLLSGKAIERTVPLYWHYYRAIGRPKAAMRVGDYMILGHWDGAQLPGGASVKPGDSQIIKDAKLSAFELYNLRRDPSQKNDLAAREPERLKELAEQLTARYLEVRAEGRTWKVEE
jgi:arylsulfatase A